MILRAGAAAVAALAAAGLVAVIVSACGGSSESASRFRAGATGVCTRALDEGARLRPPAFPAGIAAFLRRGTAVLRTEHAQLTTLRPPSEDAGAYSAAVEALGREVTILTAMVRDLDRGADPRSTIKTGQHRLAPVEAHGNAAWRTLDVPACVSR